MSADASTISRIELGARAKLDYEAYLEYVHDIKPRHHQILWVKALQALADGCLQSPESTDCKQCSPYKACSIAHATNNLIIEAFPGSGKTTFVTRWASWLISRAIEFGQTPHGGYVAYADDVAHLRSVAIRDTIKHKQPHREVFPLSIPDESKGWGQGEWFLQRPDPSDEFPTLRAAGMSAAILSYRFTFFEIIDDPHDPKLVKTAGQRDETWRIWRTAVKTRATQGVTPTVLICTRQAKDDLPGRLKEIEKNWHVIWTPALTEQEETAWPVERLPNGEYVGINTKELLDLREQDRHSFITQYMALPPSEEGDVFEKFVYERRPNKQDVTKVIQFWDTATTTKTRSSYNAMVEMWKLRNGRVWVENVINVKVKPARVIDIMLDAYWATEADEGLPNPLVCIENKHAGPAYASWLVSRAPIPVKLADIPKKKLQSRATLHGTPDQLNRATSIVAYVESGLVYFPIEWTSWKDMTIDALMAFPFDQYDDIAAAFIGGVEYLMPRTFIGRPAAPFAMKRGY